MFSFSIGKDLYNIYLSMSHMIMIGNYVKREIKVMFDEKIGKVPMEKKEKKKKIKERRRGVLLSLKNQKKLSIGD